jgi:hypothetical protein
MALHRHVSAAILPAVAKAKRSETDAVKTTVELPADLWRAAKIRAMDERVDLRTILIRALEGFLGRQASSRRAERD